MTIFFRLLDVFIVIVGGGYLINQVALGHWKTLAFTLSVWYSFWHIVAWAPVVFSESRRMLITRFAVTREGGGTPVLDVDGQPTRVRIGSYNWRHGFTKWVLEKLLGGVRDTNYMCIIADSSGEASNSLSFMGTLHPVVAASALHHMLEELDKVARTPEMQTRVSASLEAEAKQRGMSPEELASEKRRQLRTQLDQVMSLKSNSDDDNDEPDTQEGR